MRCSAGRLLGRSSCFPASKWPYQARRPLTPSASPCSIKGARPFGFDALTAVLTPPAVFGGLLVSLWTYKCVMMVIFQNKIIYMPSVPPFSRSEKVADYVKQCRPVEWTEHTIKSIDGTAIKLLEGSVVSDASTKADRHVVVLYLQGNASSLPPRLPYLSRILSGIKRDDSEVVNHTKYTIIALSYRGFWTSRGRPSQPGIELDCEAALAWLSERFHQPEAKLLIWGQSIGAGAASVALANLLKSNVGKSRLRRVSGLLLETPFVDLKSMLIALYPQKFLPYRYLSPFLRSTWDSKTALTEIGDGKSDLKVLILQAGDDELVPANSAPMLEDICQKKGMTVERVVVDGALHTEVMMKSQGRRSITMFMKSFGQGDG